MRERSHATLFDFLAEDGLCSTTAAGCEMCGVEFNGRITIQDHIFTLDHINAIKTRSSVSRNGGGASGDEQPPQQQPTSGGGSGSSGSNASRSATSRARSSESSTSAPLNATFGAAAATADGGEAAAAAAVNDLSLIYSTLLDPNVVGTPIRMLQIPTSVMEQIADDLQSGRESTNFAQDGRDFDELATTLDSDDFRCAQSTESEVRANASVRFAAYKRPFCFAGRLCVFAVLKRLPAGIVAQKSSEIHLHKWRQHFSPRSAALRVFAMLNKVRHSSEQLQSASANQQAARLSHF